MNGTGITNLLVSFPKLAAIVGITLALFFGTIGVLLVRDLASLPEKAESVSLSEIASRLRTQDRVWAEVNEPINWDCRNIWQHRVGLGQNTDSIFTDSTRTVVVMASFSGAMTCQDLVRTIPSGFFSRSNSQHIDSLIVQGFDFMRYGAHAIYLDLCAYCRRENSIIVIAVCTIMAILALMLYPAAIWCNRKEKRFSA